MLKKGGGSIINMSSGVSSIKGLPNRYAYGATKAAVIGLRKRSPPTSSPRDPLQRDLPRHHRVRHRSKTASKRCLKRRENRLNRSGRNFIARQPMARLGTAEEVAALALFLASDDSSYITASLTSWMAAWRSNGRSSTSSRACFSKGESPMIYLRGCSRAAHPRK
jgi:2-keto-3-deoxy-L-fuconate dehydrogenase